MIHRPEKKKKSPQKKNLWEKKNPQKKSPQKENVWEKENCPLRAGYQQDTTTVLPFGILYVGYGRTLKYGG
jgi:hypothetical protein